MKLRLNCQSPTTTTDNTIQLGKRGGVTTTDSIYIDPWANKRTAIDDPFDVIKNLTSWTWSYPYPQHIFTSKTSNDILTLSLDVPGIKPEGAEISINDGTLTFKGKRFDTGASVSSSIYINDNWDLDTADAEIEHGILTIKFKIKESRKPRSIQVKIK